MLSLDWDGVDFIQHQISLQKTKSGYQSQIPMTHTTEGVLKGLLQASEGQDGLVLICRLMLSGLLLSASGKGVD